MVVVRVRAMIMVMVMVIYMVCDSGHDMYHLFYQVGQG